MRAKRILWFSAGAVGGLLALAVGAAFLPGVQTWAARRALSSLAPPGASLEGFSASPSRMQLRGLRLRVQGGVLEVPQAEAEFGVFTAVARRGYLVRTLVSKGWTLDLTEPVGQGGQTRAPAGRAPEGLRVAQAVGAVLSAFNVPEDVSVDGVELDGTILIPDETGRPEGRAHVSIRGGGLGAGRTGRFTLDVEASIDDPASTVSAVEAHATLGAAMDATGTFAHADLDLDATAKGRQFPAGIALSAKGLASREAGRTTYSFALLRNAVPVAAFDAESPDGSLKLTGSWKLDLRDTDLAPFALGRRLPFFHLLGGGSYAVDAGGSGARAEGKIEASADRLGVLASALSSTGLVVGAADFDVASAGGSLRVDRLDVTLSALSNVATLRALQPFEFDPASGELKVAKPSGDLVGISVRALPLSWLRGALPSVVLSGGDAKGEFALRAENGRLALRTKVPLTSDGLSVSAGGRVLASGLGASAFILADYSLDGWQIQVAPLALRVDGVKLVSVEARIGRLSGAQEELKAAGSWSASLPGLLRQPLFGGAVALLSGDASGGIEASLGPTQEVQLRIALSNLALSPDGAAPLPRVDADLRLEFSADGRCTFKAPVSLGFGERTSRVDVSGSVERGSERPRFNASISADALGDEEAALAAALMGAGRISGPPSTGPSAPADVRAFWPLVDARVALDLREARVRGLALRNVRGTLVIASKSLSLESASAGLGEGSAARLDGSLDFEPGEQQPYALDATFVADNLPSAPLLRAAAPGTEPVVEGRFDAAGRVHARAASPEDLLDLVQGDCRLSSKDGRFRALRTEALDAVRQNPSKIAGAIDSVSALFGKKSEKLGEALTESAGGLSDIHYDQMSVVLERGEDLDVVIREISLIAPEERVTGQGRVTHVPGLAFGAQPLSVELNVGARGNLARFMGIVGLLGDTKDELGYTPLYQGIHLGGSLRDVDRSQLRDMLIQAPLRKGGGLIDKLLGR